MFSVSCNDYSQKICSSNIPDEGPKVIFSEHTAIWVEYVILGLNTWSIHFTRASLFRKYFDLESAFAHLLNSFLSNFQCIFWKDPPPSFLSLICLGQRMRKHAWIHHGNRATKHSVPSEYLLALLWVRSSILPCYREVCFHQKFLSNGTCSVKSDSESQSA